ncbi:alpha-N-acetylgalactosaminide alpha-2,6-sialyltransferase 2 isoform X2 [Eleginops maclovinus]|uniref:alpha-N-acetylgalactosaminide alpha-2,6-sialyltransferase 2 isoform X2 n=1 Tax=Eleginops maclovinus TaxID=56733 RepID=UPI0030807816
MRRSIKFIFFLLGTLCFIICIFLYSQQQSDSIESLDDNQVDWSLVSAGDEEQEVEQKIEAACSLRKAVRNDVLLREKFRFSMSVLQWVQSLKPAWEHLRKRNPPYGWRGLPVDVLGSTLSLLNSSRLFERGSPDRCVRCAVVGNGGILRGSQQGRNIDSHDFVFRMNGAVIRGFEEDVGTKISFYGFTTNTMKNSLGRYRTDGFNRIPQSPEINYIFIPSDLRDYVMIAAAVQGRVVGSGRDRRDRFLRSPLLTDVRTRHLYMPSTGALMLLTALHTCDQVSAYGFITRNYASFSDHYYDSTLKPLGFFSNHDLLMESRLWEELHHRRVLRLYQREGGN